MSQDTSSKPRPILSIPKPPKPVQTVVHKGKAGGPGSDNAQQRGWSSDKSKF